MRAIILISLLALAGCATPAQLDKEGDAKCVAWGAKPKSKDYVTCRLAEEQNQIARQAGYGAIVGGMGAAAGAVMTGGLIHF